MSMPLSSHVTQLTLHLIPAPVVGRPTEQWNHIIIWAVPQDAPQTHAWPPDTCH